PELQLRADLPGTFSHSRKAPVSRPATLFEDLWVYTAAVVINPQTKFAGIVCDFHFDVKCPGVRKSIDQGLAPNRICLLKNHGISLPHLAFDNRLEGSSAIGSGCFCDTFESGRQVGQREGGSTQAAHAVSAFCHHFIRVVERFLDGLPDWLIALLRDGMEL